MRIKMVFTYCGDRFGVVFGWQNKKVKEESRKEKEESRNSRDSEKQWNNHRYLMDAGEKDYE